jgi:hypothetical protein
MGRNETGLVTAVRGLKNPAPLLNLSEGSPQGRSTGQPCGVTGRSGAIHPGRARGNPRFCIGLQRDSADALPPARARQFLRVDDRQQPAVVNTFAPPILQSTALSPPIIKPYCIRTTSLFLTSTRVRCSERSPRRGHHLVCRVDCARSSGRQHE